MSNVFEDRRSGNFNHAPTEWGGYKFVQSAICSRGTLLPRNLKFACVLLTALLGVLCTPAVAAPAPDY
jgi:hypothetical protein